MTYADLGGDLMLDVAYGVAKVDGSLPESPVLQQVAQAAGEASAIVPVSGGV